MNDIPAHSPLLADLEEGQGFDAPCDNTVARTYAEVRTCAEPAVGWDGYCTRTKGHDDEHRYESAYTLFTNMPMQRMMP